MNIDIREATRADRNAIETLTTQTLTEHRARLPDHFAEDMAAPLRFFDDLMRRKSKGFVLVAEVEGRVVGWTGLAVFEVPAGEDKHDRLGIVMDITVTEDRRGEGIGTALVEALVAQARETGVTLIQADVWKGGPSAGILTRAGLQAVRTTHDTRLAPRRKGPPPAQRWKQVAEWLQTVVVVLVALILILLTFR